MRNRLSAGLDPHPLRELTALIQTPSCILDRGPSGHRIETKEKGESEGEMEGRKQDGGKVEMDE